MHYSDAPGPKIDAAHFRELYPKRGKFWPEFPKSKMNSSAGAAGRRCSHGAGGDGADDGARGGTHGGDATATGVARASCDGRRWHTLAGAETHKKSYIIGTYADTSSRVVVLR